MREIVLTREAAIAAFNALSNTPFKGRSNMRMHAGIMAEVRSNCMSNEAFEGGKINLSDDRFGYLKESVDAVIDSGVNGQLAGHYTALLEALEGKQTVSAG